MAPSFAKTRTAAQWLCVLASTFSVACSKRVEPPQATGGPIVSASAAVVSPMTENHRQLSCKGQGSTFTLGPVESDRRTEGDSDRDAEGSPEDLPFGVSVGMALARKEGYVISAIDARPDGNHAVLVVTDSEIAKTKVVDLGRVYGDAEPPRVILQDGVAFVVVPDGSAMGGMYRYGWLRDLDSTGHVQWLGTIEERNDDSAVFALATTGSNVVMAWDDVERKSRSSRVNWGVVGRPESAKAGDKRDKSEARDKTTADLVVQSTNLDNDAEGPQLAAHRAGYWLAYLVSERQGTKSKNARVNGASSSRGGKSGVDDEVRPVDLGRRGVYILPLDVEGHVNGKPIAITERSAHVMTFEIAAMADGGALVAYRDIDTAPGAEAQLIELVRVRPDGGIARQHLEDDRIGAGMPTLLVDSAVTTAASSTGTPWVALSGGAGETRIAEIAEPLGAAPLELADAPALAGVDPLLRRGDALLVARHRARFVEFERLDCRWPTIRPQSLP